MLILTTFNFSLSARWYLNGMSPIDEPPNVNVHNKKMNGFAKYSDIPTYEGPPPPDFDGTRT